MKRAIIIFSRIPVPGQTKTRLMPYLSGDQCAQLHLDFIKAICRTVKKVDADVIVSYTPECTGSERENIFGESIRAFFLQEGKDLGERMHRAFVQAFARGYERVLLIGTDIPQISAQVLEDSFSKLSDADIVVNPTEDGGYYLIGMKKPHEDIWNVEHYGTNSVFEDTMRRIHESGLSVEKGAVLLDIDTIEDFRKWKGLNVEDCIGCDACKNSCLFLSKYNINTAELSGKNELAYSCFLCGKCRDVCPVGIDGASVAYEMRRQNVVNNGEKIPGKTYDGLMWEKNPYKFANYKNGNKKSVLFPGCNFPAFFPKTMKSLEQIMSRHDIGIVYDCCGKPVKELGLDRDVRNNIKTIEKNLKAQGVEEIILLCPNCYYFLRDKIDIPMVTIYRKLRELGEGKQVVKDEFPIYDPCPDREEGIFYQDIQLFLSGEIIKCYEDVQCCGLGGCAGAIEPELAQQMVDLAKDKKKELYTYCASCISNFRRKGMAESIHILPAILEIEEEIPGGIRPFLNRAIKKLL